MTRSNFALWIVIAGLVARLFYVQVVLNHTRIELSNRIWWQCREWDDHVDKDLACGTLLEQTNNPNRMLQERAFDDWVK